MHEKIPNSFIVITINAWLLMGSGGLFLSTGDLRAKWRGTISDIYELALYGAGKIQKNDLRETRGS